MASDLTKEKRISLRMDGELHEELEKLVKSKKTKKSKIIRNIIFDYINYSETFRQTQTVYISSDMLKFALMHMDEKEIPEFARIAVKYEIDIISKLIENKKFLKPLQLLANAENYNRVISNILSFIGKNYLSPKGRGWFSKIQTSHKGEIFMISGKHRLGKNFSTFIHEYYKILLSNFKYQEQISERVQRSDYCQFSFLFQHKPGEKFVLKKEIANMAKIVNQK